MVGNIILKLILVLGRRLHISGTSQVAVTGCCKRGGKTTGPTSGREYFFSCGAAVHLVMSYYVMSCHVVSCRVVSCRVVSCRAVPCRVVSCRVVPCRVVSCRVGSCRVVSCCVVSCLIVSCVVLCCVVLCYVIFITVPHYTTPLYHGYILLCYIILQSNCIKQGLIDNPTRVHLGKNIRRILWDRKVHCRVFMNVLLNPLLGLLYISQNIC